MVHIPPFEVTIWIEQLEDGCKYDLATTCASSISLDELEELSVDPATTSAMLSPRSLKLSYGPMRGSDRLRQNIAALYRSPTVTQESILTTNGGIVANQIVLQALLSADDHVVVMYPTYEQLYQTPRMLGAEVTLWKLTPSSSPEDKWEWTLDLAFLRSAIKPNTKMLVLNSPNNPTGAHLSADMQKQILAIAAEHDLIVFCDEVFYPLFRMEDPPSSFLDLNYDKAIVIGSLSKAYSLAGTRTGWIASANSELLDRCAAMRHYTTISVSQIDEAIAAEALADRCRLPLLARANRLATTNIHALETFVEEHRGRCSWSKPVAGTTAMLLFMRDGRPVDDKEFCLRLLRTTGVLLCPASVCFGDGKESADFRGFVRVGAAIDTAEMAGALREMRRFMAEGFAEVPLAPA
ncbi:PLP-dependent transferase [Aspergillus uvarum CBS 121591]|uniref:PLP-dependent transferase n=1 Tax=Aspergillus uvarum CBS 121591 TaxID=1448315 RepID=A0A319CI03_9EURO|nr:PLP-dependent transferase [Aspergillus uvarum CBS 121591]PYH85406.1 PLP-dependent transferase [Aspergillus uvarum CBS 121591]